MYKYEESQNLITCISMEIAYPSSNNGVTEHKEAISN